MAFILAVLLACDLRVMVTSSGWPDCVERRDGAAETSGVPVTVDVMSLTWSLPSRIGQFFAREPITSTCFNSEPWSQCRRIEVMA
jgi:hypothetical protein